VNGSQFFAWYDTTPASYPVSTYPSGSTTGSYIGVPFLTDANAAAVNLYLTGASGIRAVKIENPGISNATANLIFNNTNYNVSYVFGDLEGATANAAAANLAKQVKWAGAVPNTTKNKSYNAWVGNFGFTTQSTNSQKPTYYTNTGQHSYSSYQYNEWNNAGLSMSNEEAYPGSPSMRNKASGDVPQGSGTYNNIRGAIFVLPLWRVGQATDGAQSNGVPNFQHIPWTANFNNWGQPGLDTDRNPANGYKFIPGSPMPAATIGGHYYPAQSSADTTNQMVSERDFATSMLHMRMRGADSFHLLDSGIQGITQNQMQQDAATGWLGESTVNQIFAQADKRTLIGLEPLSNTNGYTGANYSGGSIIVVDGNQKNVDQTGNIFSGAYSLTLKKLDVLLSNMDDNSHQITLPGAIGGYALATSTFTVPGGDHLLVDYSLATSGANKNKWVVASQHVPFTAISNSRGGFGIPEPGTLSLLAVAGVFGLNRRKRNVQ
jgi:hypothetical protein